MSQNSSNPRDFPDDPSRSSARKFFYLELINEKGTLFQPIESVFIRYPQKSMDENHRHCKFSKNGSELLKVILFRKIACR